MSIDEPVADVLARAPATLSAEEILADAAARYPGRVALASSLSARGPGPDAHDRQRGPRHPDLHARHRPPPPRDPRAASTAPTSATACRMRDVLPRRGRGREDGRQTTASNLFRDSEFQARQLCCETRKIAAAAARAGRAGRLDLRPAQRPGHDPGEKVESAGVGPADAGLLKLNPLAAWDEARVWDYVRAQRRALQPAARPGLHDRRLRAVPPRTLSVTGQSPSAPPNWRPISLRCNGW